MSWTPAMNHNVPLLRCLTLPAPGHGITSPEVSLRLAMFRETEMSLLLVQPTTLADGERGFDSVVKRAYCSCGGPSSVPSIHVGRLLPTYTPAPEAL